MLEPKEKEKLKKKRKGIPSVIEREYPIGKVVHYEAPVYFMKKGKRDSMDAVYTLIDGPITTYPMSDFLLIYIDFYLDTVPSDMRIAEYTENQKKCDIIYIVVDLTNRTAFEDVFFIVCLFITLTNISHIC